MRTKLSNLFRTKNKVGETKAIPTIQGEYLGKTTQGVFLNPKGSHSSPPLDTPCIILHVDDSTKMVIPINTSRPKDLAINDYAIFAHNLASIIRCMGDGTIKMNADNKVEITAPQVIINSNVLINGSVTTTGTGSGAGIITAKDVVTDNVSSVNTHTHGGVQTGSGSTGAPN